MGTLMNDDVMIIGEYVLVLVVLVVVVASNNTS
jgi:hypothetical protein